MSIENALLLKAAYSMRNRLRTIRQQSTFKVVFILAFAVCLEVGLFAIFLDGLKYLNAFGGIGSLLITRLFALFFLSISMMLVFSGIITSYSTFFASHEIPYLLTRPFSVTQIVNYKFLESLFLSSWAFFFVVIPFVGAFAVHQRLSLSFGIWTLILSVPFVIICAGIGSALVMLGMRWMPRGRTLNILLGMIAMLAVLGVFFMFREAREMQQEAHFNIARLVPGLRVSNYPLLPSWWLSEGIMALSRRDWLRGGMFGLTLCSSAGVAWLLMRQVGERCFYIVWTKSIAGRARRTHREEIFPAVARSLRWLPHDIQAIVMKDMRTFFRDPLQWSQVLIFFGLLGLYFANLRALNYHTLPEVWRHSIAFLNIFSISAVICSLGPRFVFPQVSLEGQGFWILGLAPTSMRRILVTKFCVIAASLVMISILLMTLSLRMLGAPPRLQGVALALVSCIALSVSGLSMGLGAVFMDLEQRNPAAIVSSFGGTLNFVLSLLLMLLAIAPPGIILHAELLGAMAPDTVKRALAASLGWLAILTTLSTVLPLHLGIRSLEKRDF